MNCLFIGPYRQNNDEGNLSRLYLEKIANIYYTTSRPFYIKYKPILSHEYIFNTEINSSGQYDILVQHLPIDNLSINKNCEYNLCIPIVDSRVLSNNQLNKLNSFDKILIDNIHLYNALSSKINNKKFKLISPDISKIEFHNNKYNLSLYDFSHKIYGIFDFKRDLDLIDQLCISFLRLNKEQTNISLLLFIYNTDQLSIQNLSTKIKELYKLFNNKTSSINIIPISIDIDLASLLLCHNTGDLFIDLSCNKTPLNHHIAKRLNKLILDIESMELSVSLVKNNLYDQNGFYSIVTDDLYKKIKHILLTKTISNTYNKFDKIESIL